MSSSRRVLYWRCHCTCMFFFLSARYNGAVDVVKTIIARDGVLGLWKGWLPNCQRAAIVCLGGDCLVLL